MKQQVVIAGAGPAGMLLAYQLASNGVPVRVLEQHADFEREFRGELIGPSMLPVLDGFGILPALVERGAARRDVERVMYVGLSRRVTLPMGKELGALVSQPALLGLLHEMCGKYPNYEMQFRTTALRARKEGERVVGVEVKREGVEEVSRGDVVVACNGRNSRLRKESGVGLELDIKPDNTVWLRFDLSDAREVLPETLDVRMFGGGVVVVTFATTRSRLQIAYSAPGDVGALRKDPAALREVLLPRLPEKLQEVVAKKLDGEIESQVLSVSIDRLAKWHVPGMLFLGDAAHTMGPAGAQGLNLALRDAVVAANHMLDAIQAGKEVDETVFAAIEAERRPEIVAAQEGQLRAYGMVQKPRFAQHVMFTMLGAVMKVKKFAATPPPVVEPKYGVPIV